MSKKVKVLISVLVAVVLLTVGGAAVVMAQEEEPAPTPEPGTKMFMATANTTGFLARVADILGITQEELVDAFREARQEMREEAFFNYLDKAVEEGLITEEEAGEIREWWEQKPDALDRSALRAHISKAVRGQRMMAVPGKLVPETWRTQEQAGRIKERWQSSPEALNRPVLRAHISKAIRVRQQVAVSKEWCRSRLHKLAD